MISLSNEAHAKKKIRVQPGICNKHESRLVRKKKTPKIEQYKGHHLN